MDDGNHMPLWLFPSQRQVAAASEPYLVEWDLTFTGTRLNTLIFLLPINDVSKLLTDQLIVCAKHNKMKTNKINGMILIINQPDQLRIKNQLLERIQIFIFGVYSLEWKSCWPDHVSVIRFNATTKCISCFISNVLNFGVPQKDNFYKPTTAPVFAFPRVVRHNCLTIGSVQAPVTCIVNHMLTYVLYILPNLVGRGTPTNSELQTGGKHSYHFLTNVE